MSVLKMSRYLSRDRLFDALAQNITMIHKGLDCHRRKSATVLMTKKLTKKLAQVDRKLDRQHQQALNDLIIYDEIAESYRKQRNLERRLREVRKHFASNRRERVLNSVR